MKQEFIEFLKNHGAYDRYVRNAKRDHGATIDGITLRHEYRYWISCAFDWDTTEEGLYYWKELNDKWKERAQEILDRLIEN